MLAQFTSLWYHLLLVFYNKYITCQGNIMAGKCDLCGKTPQFGHNVSHSKRHTKRQWLPNIRRVTLMMDGKRRQLNICTRCLRTQRKLAH
jgi:large subunit ribosomal protein L28